MYKLSVIYSSLIVLPESRPNQMVNQLVNMTLPDSFIGLFDYNNGYIKERLSKAQFHDRMQFEMQRFISRTW